MTGIDEIHTQALKMIDANKGPILSLLYDMDLMPEQLERGSLDWRRMVTLVERLDSLLKPKPKPFQPAIDRLESWAKELRPQIEAEKDATMKARLMDEFMTCTTAASFLLNDDGA